MKKRVFALVCLLLCLFAAAAGAESTSSLAERFLHGLPPGMEADVNVLSNGYLEIEIDTHATDWDMVATAAKKSGSLAIYPGLEAPKNADGEYDVQGLVFFSDIARKNGESMAAAENRVLSELMKNPDFGNNGIVHKRSYQGWSIGSYDEGTGLFLPMNIEQGWASMVVGWRKNDSSLDVEFVRFCVRFTELTPIYTSCRLVRAGDEKSEREIEREGDIQTNIMMNEWSLDKEKARPDVTDGRIIYEVSADVYGEVHTAIAAPYKANWTEAYLLSNGEETRRELRTGTYFTDRPYIVQFYNINKANILDKKDWAIKWVDDQGNVVVTGLEAVFKIGEQKFTAAYPGKDQDNRFKAAATAMPSSRLKYEISNPLDGLRVSISDGHIHMSIEEEDLPPNREADLSRTTMSAQVLTPENAKAFKVYSMRGDIIYGDWGEKQYFVDRIPVQGGQWMSVPDFTDRNFFKAYHIVLHNGKYITYYVAPSTVGRYGGETLIFEWEFNGGGTSREYVSLTADPYQIRRNPSETKNPNKLVEAPVVQTNMDVEIAMLPQMGEGIIRYEITLYDENGNKPVLQQPVKLYLPYPDGKTMEACENEVFVVYHQNSQGEMEEYSVQDGNLTLTEYGLCMEVTSFSPYYISWDPAPDTSALPETGDRSAIWLCALLLAASAAGIMAMRKRDRSAA